MYQNRFIDIIPRTELLHIAKDTQNESFCVRINIPEAQTKDVAAICLLLQPKHDQMGLAKLVVLPSKRALEKHQSIAGFNHALKRRIEPEYNELKNRLFYERDHPFYHAATFGEGSAILGFTSLRSGEINRVLKELASEYQLPKAVADKANEFVDMARNGELSKLPQLLKQNLSVHATLLQNALTPGSASRYVM